MKNSLRSNITNKRPSKGFKKTSNFIHELAQKSFEKRGFAISKLITNWKEIVGPKFFEISKPVKMTFVKSSLGANLLIEIDGAFGPELELQKNFIKETINRLYGYTAVTNVQFKVSSFLGYNSSYSGGQYLDKNKNIEKNKNTYNSDWIARDMILKLEGVKDEKLRNSLISLSKNFVNSLK